MSETKLDSLQHIWEDDISSKKVSGYLYGAYSRLEQDFLSVLEYVPLRESHLHVSSSRFADFILRSSPLINKIFRTMTFSKRTLKQLEWEINPENSYGISSDDYDSIQELLLNLHSLKKRNRDSISHYHKWISSGLFYKLYPINEDDVVTTQLKTEVIESEFTLNPFGNDVWGNWIDNRRKIEHRDQTEASIQCVLNGLAIIAKLLVTYADISNPGDWFQSDLFDVYSSIVWIHDSRRFSSI